MSIRNVALIGLLMAGCTSGTTNDSENVASPAVEESAPAIPTSTFEVEDGFRLLTLAEFAPFPADADSWSEEGGELVCSGSPKGYIYSQDVFRDFTLRADYRFEPTADSASPDAPSPNTGFMLAIQEPHKVWPASLEVQGKHSEMCSIKSNGGVPDLVIQDNPESREVARRPVGEWNSVEIVMQAGAVTATLNGTVICTSEPGELREGMIGLQSEGFVVRFRNLRVRAEPAASSAP